MRTPWQTIVQPTIEEILRTYQVPGIVIALTREDGPVEHLVLGTDGQARPLHAETLFPVASITKLATSLAILRLAAAGALIYRLSWPRMVPSSIGRLLLPPAWRHHLIARLGRA
jgi:hypothetical protein